jgi:hypothetical protein
MCTRAHKPVQAVRSTGHAAKGSKASVVLMVVTAEWGCLRQPESQASLVGLSNH